MRLLASAFALVLLAPLAAALEFPAVTPSEDGASCNGTGAERRVCVASTVQTAMSCAPLGGGLYCDHFLAVRYLAWSPQGEEGRDIEAIRADVTSCTSHTPCRLHPYMAGDEGCSWQLGATCSSEWSLGGTLYVPVPAGECATVTIRAAAHIEAVSRSTLRRAVGDADAKVEHDAEDASTSTACVP